MIASILGPSGSDRRMFTLVALTILLMPWGALAAKIAFDQLPLYDVMVIGCMGTAIAMALCVSVYGCVSMVVHGLLHEPGIANQNWEHDAKSIAV